jgi:HEAT repeat protein
MLSAPGPALLARYGRWYIPERDPRYLRRNALLVLANVGDGRAPEVEAALQRYLDDPDEILRAHAIWAAARLGRLDLLACRPGLRDDPSATVQDELRRVADVVARPPSLPRSVWAQGTTGGAIPARRTSP